MTLDEVISYKVSYYYDKLSKEKRKNFFSNHFLPYVGNTSPKYKISDVSIDKEHFLGSFVITGSRNELMDYLRELDSKFFRQSNLGDSSLGGVHLLVDEDEIPPL